MDCSLQGSSIHGILQARMLEWVAFPSPGDLPDPGIECGSPAFQAAALPSEPPGKPMISLDSILKCRDTILPTKFHRVKAMVFPVVMYGSENWTVTKGEPQGIDAFELWCWRRPLRVTWTARRSIQSILKEISPGCSLEGLMLKLKHQYFGHVM